MANKQRGEVSIKLDRVRKLKFTTNAIAELEEALGCSISGMENLDIGVKEMRKMFWASMLEEEPTLTFKEAGLLMDYGESYKYISEKVMEALGIAFNDANDKKDTEKN